MHQNTMQRSWDLQNILGMLASQCQKPLLEPAAVIVGSRQQGLQASQCQKPQLKQAAVVSRSGKLGVLASRCPLLRLADVVTGARWQGC